MPINQDKDAAVGELSFTDCTFSGFESSVFRTKGGVVSVDKILVDNCVMTNMSTGGGYPVFYIGHVNTNVGKLELKNSTFDTTSHNFIQLKAAISGGVTISDCTFYNNVSGSKYFMDSNKLSTNLTIIRTVLGMPWMQQQEVSALQVLLLSTNLCVQRIVFTVLTTLKSLL